jgi:hypothetical protein
VSGAKHGEPGHVRHDTACYGCACEALGIDQAGADAIRAHHALHDRMVSMLRKLEWIGEGHPRCPECNRLRPDHSQVCELESLLDEVGRDP